MTRKKETPLHTPLPKDIASAIKEQAKGNGRSAGRELAQIAIRQIEKKLRKDATK